VAYGSKNRKRIIDLIGTLRSFQIGNMSANWYPTPLAVPIGSLPGDAILALRALDGDTPVYVIFSYVTPIAWRLAGRRWVAPSHRYSRTTTHHQDLAAQGMALWDHCLDAAA